MVENLRLVDTRRWGCYPWHGHGPTPWNPAGPHGSDSCLDGAYCGALMNASVGRDPAMHHAYDPAHPNIASYFSGEWSVCVAKRPLGPDHASL